MAYTDKTKLLVDINNGIKAGNLEEGYEQYQNINNMDDIIETIEWADEADVVERVEYDKLEKEYKYYKRLAEQDGELRLKLDKAIKEISNLHGEYFTVMDKDYKTTRKRFLEPNKVVDILKSI